MLGRMPGQHRSSGWPHHPHPHRRPAPVELRRACGRTSTSRHPLAASPCASLARQDAGPTRRLAGGRGRILCCVEVVVQVHDEKTCGFVLVLALRPSGGGQRQCSLGLRHGSGQTVSWGNSGNSSPDILQQLANLTCRPRLLLVVLGLLLRQRHVLVVACRPLTFVVVVDSTLACPCLGSVTTHLHWFAILLASDLRGVLPRFS